MPTRASFDYAIIRVVPRVEREEFLNAGVILFCRSARYLAARVALDRERLRAFAPAVDSAEVEGQLDLLARVADGDPTAGPIAELPPAERFHWLVAPRSTVIEISPVHSGLTADPEATLGHLVATMVDT